MIYEFKKDFKYLTHNKIRIKKLTSGLRGWKKVNTPGVNFFPSSNKKKAFTRLLYLLDQITKLTFAKKAPYILVTYIYVYIDASHY